MELSRTYRSRIAARGKELMLALLEHAVEEKYALAHNTLGKELFQEAEEWFFTANNESLYSFENICEYSLINSNYLPTAPTSEDCAA
jgi:hypothetical protein